MQDPRRADPVKPYNAQRVRRWYARMCHVRGAKREPDERVRPPPSRACHVHALRGGGWLQHIGAGFEHTTLHQAHSCCAGGREQRLTGWGGAGGAVGSDSDGSEQWATDSETSDRLGAPPPSPPHTLSHTSL
jgi:hypothetical protein